jgi:hypothetical protein
MNILKQSTAATIKLGPFVDDTDGKTAETALTIGQADIRLSKNGGDIAQTHNATGATHDELGYYDIPLDTTDTGTLGRLRVLVSKAGALPVWQEYLVVTANVYDTLCSTDTFDVNVTSLADDVITAAKFDESTAYPLKSADTGSTQVARVGADSDTLETLSDEIAAVKAETALIVEDTGTTGVLLSTSALGSIFDDEVIVGTYTFSDLLKILAAALAGKLSGGGTTTLTFRGVDDASDVIVTTVDANKNRTNVVITV